MSYTSEIVNVALAGKGRFGSVVLDELLKAGFKLTVLTRSASSLKDLPDGVEVRQVDYSSLESLQQSLQGHDAVVSTVAGAAVASQKPLIDAAISAGVKHFIPADYAMSLKSPGIRALPPYTDVLEIENYLRARSDRINWTIVACGGFLEYLFDLPFLLDLKNRTIEIVNGGDIPFSTSEFSTAAKAIAGALKQPERVSDHCIQVHAILITQKMALEIVKKYDPKPEFWVVSEEDGDVQFEKGLNMLKSGQLTMAAASTLMAGAIWSGEHKAAFEETDNEWLRIEMIARERLEEILKIKVLNGISTIASDQIISNF
ncbi:hypothetical protein V495_05325 [Pseudogymnoascus sp. VKM F-4514 (FW-929)]|nr:hypothetical protein V495_05325 [Pseudogymnoascus sp. VKM F-4514 (FW-929)]KFY63155.1 hypothetical protein V497_02101 [Pseudogymnoascus sp. VKM F-4516 (FW-969)]